MKRGACELPLHGGKAPRWLFHRMKKLAREIILIIISEFGADKFLDNLSDPFWFQAFGCLLGFDWHSSGVTTTTCGAIKEALKGLEQETGIFMAGGKGGQSRKTPMEIAVFCEKCGLEAEKLVYASKMSAKVDSAAVQDGYQLYHHIFTFTRNGKWAVIQQGMNDANRMARRYHWLSTGLNDFVSEPHKAVCCDQRGAFLNLAAKESGDSRSVSADLSRKNPKKTISDFLDAVKFRMPKRHGITPREIQPKNLGKILISTYENQPRDFEDLLGIKGVGAKSIRALALTAEIIYGAKPSFRDPARFSFAHGGKDGIPYPVNRVVYDQTIDILDKITNRAKIERTEKKKAFRRLYDFQESIRGENVRK